MSMWPQAQLLYGHYLGCASEDEWAISDAGKYGELGDRPWLYLDTDPREAMRIFLLKQAGVTDVEILEAGYMGRAKLTELMALHYDIDVVSTGHLEHPQISIVYPALTCEAPGTQPTPVTPETSPVRLLLANGRLRRALDLLGLTPNQACAAWLLSPIYI